MFQLKEDLFYVGVNDRQKERFEGLWPLPYGVSYNSYLIKDEKVALIDTVDVTFFEEYLKKIRRILGERPIDYLIINHMEPDHSGSLELIRQVYPDICLVGNKKTLDMVKGYYGSSCTNELTVKEASLLDLGKHKLRFYLTPMVHWPETMVTYDETGCTIFSGDAFGCFGAINGSPLDTRVDTNCYRPEMERYYTNIVGKYGAMVQNALKKLRALHLEMICSTHGPVWTSEIPKAIDIYDRLSRYEAKPGAVICYGSMYGHTMQMAETVAEGLAENGVDNIIMYDVCRTHLSYIITDIFRYRLILLGAPTYNGELFPPMQSLIEAIKSRGVKGRLAGCFGEFTWSGQAVKSLTNFIEEIGWKNVGEAVEVKQGITTGDYDLCKALGKQAAEELRIEN